VGSTSGFSDATRLFKQPTGIAIDASGNLYVADCYNHRIRKITSAGVVTTLAGDGYEWLGYGGLQNGNGTSASFSYPTDVVFHSERNCLYVADKENNVIRKISLSSPYAVTTFAGTAGGTSGSSNTGSGSFNKPEGITLIDNSGSSTD
jgi:DNA-binding beta-propeller fold protein YncE